MIVELDEYVPRAPAWSDGKREPPVGLPLVEMLLGLKAAPICAALTDDARIDVGWWQMEREGVDDEDKMLRLFELLAELEEPTDDPAASSLTVVALEE